MWCHNPEGLSPSPEIAWAGTRCIACGECARTCPNGVYGPAGPGGRDRSRCLACGACARACPSGALQLLGREVGASALAAELSRDRVFFETSGGGVTFSGGECLAQPDLFVEAAVILRAGGTPVALDTSGLAARATFDRAALAADLVLYDIKLIDPARHKAATGADNRLILDNARALAASGRRFWVRFPVIPGLTDDDENVRAVSEFIGREMAAAERVDFLPYNNLCEADYRRLGLPFALADRKPLSPQEMGRVADLARQSGLDKPHWRLV